MADTSSGFSVEDAAQIALLTNEQIMQWYALTHQTTIPVNPNQPIFSSPTPGGGRLSLPSNTLIVLALAVVAVVILSRS